MAMELLDVFDGSNDLLELPRGAVLFEEGEKAEFMYVLVAGDLALSLHDRPLTTLKPGDIVGEMALLGADIRGATATAVSDCKLAAIDAHSFKSLIRHVPEFALHVMGVMASRLQNADERLISRS